MPRLAPALKRSLSAGKQAGYTLLELSIVIAITTLLATFASKAFVDGYQDNLAESTGGYHKSLKSVLENYTTTYVTELTNNLPITGPTIPGNAATPYTLAAANTLLPTFADLVNLGVMPSGFPVQNPFKQNMQIRVVRSAGCPAAGCQITGYAYTTTPVQVTNGRDVYLANAARAKSDGYGMITQPTDPTRLAGRNCDAIPNPVAGNPANIIGVCSVLNAGLYAQFVRRGDSRVTDLNNDLNVNGAITSTGGISATGGITAASVAASGSITSANGPMLVTGNGPTSRVGAGTGAGGCSLAELSVSGGAGRIVANAANCVARVVMDAAGGILRVNDASGTTVVAADGNTATVVAGANPSTAVTMDGSAGRLTAPVQVGVTQGGGALRATMDSAGIITARDTTGNSTVVVDGGNSRLSVSGNRVVLDGTNGKASADALQTNTAGAVAQGSACAAAQNGEVRQNSATPGALLVCQSGAFVPVGLRVVAANAACPLAGEIAITSAGDTMFCKPAGGGPAGFFVPMRNLMSDFVFVASTYVRDGSTLPKPTCAQFGGSTGAPLVFVVGQTEGSPDASFNRYAVDNGASWTIRLKRGDNVTSLVGELALAQQYCYYAS